MRDVVTGADARTVSGGTATAQQPAYVNVEVPQKTTLSPAQAGGASVASSVIASGVISAMIQAESGRFMIARIQPQGNVLREAMVIHQAK